MSGDKARRVLSDIRRQTDEFTIKRKRRDISEHQKSLEEYDG